MIKLLLDQGLPRSAASLLRVAGYDAVHTGEIDLYNAGDEDLLERARTERRVIVTLDADFHALMALSGAVFPSVVRIRIEGLRARPLADLLLRVIKEYGEELDLGAILTV